MCASSLCTTEETPDSRTWKKVGKPCGLDGSFIGGGAQARARAGNVSDLKNLGPPPQFPSSVVKSRRDENACRSRDYAGDSLGLIPHYRHVISPNRARRRAMDTGLSRSH